MIKLDNPEQPVSWGFHAYRYFHPIQKAAFEMEQSWIVMKGWDCNFQNMNKAEMIAFLESSEATCKRLLNDARQLPDDGKKPSEFPPIEDCTSEKLQEISNKPKLN